MRLFTVILSVLRFLSGSRRKLSLVEKLFYSDFVDRLTIRLNTILVKNGKFPYKPFLNEELSSHAGVVELLENFDDVREELLNASRGARSIQGDLFFEDDITDDGLWDRVYLKWYSKPFKDALASCPKTVGIIERHKDIRLAMVSILKPHAVIKPHFGPWAGSYRCLLGIQTPNSPECAITVMGHKAWWKDGEAMFFDDTFEHSVVNNTEDYRIVLFLDIERPMKTRFYSALRWTLNRTLTALIRRD